MKIRTTGHNATVTITPKDEEIERLKEQKKSLCLQAAGLLEEIKRLTPEHQPPASGDAEPEGDADAPE